MIRLVRAVVGEERDRLVQRVHRSRTAQPRQPLADRHHHRVPVEVGLGVDRHGAAVRPGGDLPVAIHRHHTVVRAGPRHCERPLGVGVAPGVPGHHVQLRGLADGREPDRRSTGDRHQRPRADDHAVGARRVPLVVEGGHQLQVLHRRRDVEPPVRVHVPRRGPRQLGVLQLAAVRAAHGDSDRNIEHGVRARRQTDRILRDLHRERRIHPYVGGGLEFLARGQAETERGAQRQESEGAAGAGVAGRIGVRRVASHTASPCRRCGFHVLPLRHCGWVVGSGGIVDRVYRGDMEARSTRGELLLSWIRAGQAGRRKTQALRWHHGGRVRFHPHELPGALSAWKGGLAGMLSRRRPRCLTATKRKNSTYAPRLRG